MSAVSMVYSQSESNQKEVFLFQNITPKTKKDDVSIEIDKVKNEDITHLKAICFLRPTDENIKVLQSHLKSPQFSEYHIYFSNILPKSYLKQLADADDNEVVRTVQEFYGDYYPVNSDLFSLNIKKVQMLNSVHWGNEQERIFSRIVSGVASTLLSFKKTPVIRYQSGSDMCKKIALELTSKMREVNNLFEFARTEGDALLLILDRKEDPITPLLTQWTYQALVHECLEIHNHRVDMKHAPNVQKEFRELVLSPESDQFFKSIMYHNWGDVAMKIHDLVQNYSKQNKGNSKLQTFEEMRDFVDKYPQFRALQTNACKHMAIVEEIHRQIETRSLLKVSELEQELACTDNHDAAYETLEKIIKSSETNYSDDDKIRLLMLYGLRYENIPNKLVALTAMLRQRMISNPEKVELIRQLMDYAGSDKRALDLYNNKNDDAVSTVNKFFEVLAGDFQGAQSVLTQHKPLLSRIINQVNTQSLKFSEFPVIEGEKKNYSPKFIIVFIYGGATFEEATFINELNSKNDKQRIILGGTTIHNSSSFLQDLNFRR